MQKFIEGYKSFGVGKLLATELSVPFDRRYSHPAALSTNTYGVKRIDLLKISFSWQMLLMKRNSFVFVFKFVQVILFTSSNFVVNQKLKFFLHCIALHDLQLLLVLSIMTSVFFRTTMHHNTLGDGGVYLGALYFGILMILFNGFLEVPLLIAKLPVIYKHRDSRIYPCWTYTLPSWILTIPISLIESIIWVAVTYYAIGFDPQITR